MTNLIIIEVTETKDEHVAVGGSLIIHTKEDHFLTHYTKAINNTIKKVIAEISDEIDTNNN